MTRRHITVAAAIIRQGPFILAAKRPASGPYGSQWEFPGGKLEPGESPEEALKRELREELNITALKCRHAFDLAHSYPEFEITLHVFTVDAYSGELAALDEQTLAWLLPNEAAALPFLAADVPIVDKLLTGNL